MDLPILPVELWESLPPQVQAALLAQQQKLTNQQNQVQQLQQQVQQLLAAGVSYPDKRVVTFSWQLGKLEERLWVFVAEEGIEPTNNAAERALRPAVIWRKLVLVVKVQGENGLGSEC